MTINQIVNKIKQKGLRHKPIIIAIDGFGGAGKTTFAARLKTELKNAYVIDVDDYYIKGKLSDANKSNFDRKRLEQEVLLPLKNGQAARHQKLDYVANTLSDFIPVPDVNYLIIEGVSSLHPDIADYSDYKIWIEVPGDVAKNRMIKRDLAMGIDEGGLWQHNTETYQAYKDLYRPEEAADFIFDNGQEL